MKYGYNIHACPKKGQLEIEISIEHIGDDDVYECQNVVFKGTTALAYQGSADDVRASIAVLIGILWGRLMSGDRDTLSWGTLQNPKVIGNM